MPQNPCITYTSHTEHNKCSFKFCCTYDKVFASSCKCLVLPSSCLCSRCTFYLERPPLFVLRSKIYIVVSFKIILYIYISRCYFTCLLKISSTFRNHFQWHSLQNASLSFLLLLKNYCKYHSGMHGNFKGDMATGLISMLCLIIKCTFVINPLILNSNLKTCHLFLAQLQ